MFMDFRSRFAAALGSATETQAAEILILHNVSKWLDDYIEHFGLDLDVFNNAFAETG